MNLFKHIMLFICLCLISYLSVSAILFVLSCIFNFTFTWDLSFKVWVILWILKIAFNELKDK